MHILKYRLLIGCKYPAARLMYLLNSHNLSVESPQSIYSIYDILLIDSDNNYSAKLRKIEDSHSVSNFGKIIFLKFFDINFQDFVASLLAEQKSCSRIFFKNGILGVGKSRKSVFFHRIHFFLFETTYCT
jgi:hypothetical protein